MAGRAGNLTRPWALLLVVLLLAASALAWLAHPVCVPLSEADVESFNRWQPIEAWAKLRAQLGSKRSAGNVIHNCGRPRNFLWRAAVGA